MQTFRIYVQEVVTRCYSVETTQANEADAVAEFLGLPEREQEKLLETSDLESWNIVDVMWGDEQ